MAFLQEKNYNTAYDKLHGLFVKYAEHTFKYAESEDDVLVQLNSEANAFNILLILAGIRTAYTFHAYEDQSEDQLGDEEIDEVTERLVEDITELVYTEFELDEVGIKLTSQGFIWITRKNILSKALESKSDTIIDFPMSTEDSTSSDLVEVQFNLFKGKGKYYTSAQFIFFRMIYSPSKVQTLRAILAIYERVVSFIEIVDFTVTMSITF
jgi:hypothetical protein